MSTAARTVFGATAIATAAALGLAVTTPPRSGPNCRAGCLEYPYTAAAAYVPRDYLWMYTAVLVSVLAVPFAVYASAWLPAHRRSAATTGMCFTAIAAGVLVVDYGVQLAVLQPALLAGQTEGLSLWSQYNPHGIFIALEDVGYATMAAALLALGHGLRAAELSPSRRSRPARVAGWIFIMAGAAVLVSLAALGIGYGSRLEYRFEVLSLLIVWLALIGGGAALVRAR